MKHYISASQFGLRVSSVDRWTTLGFLAHMLRVTTGGRRGLATSLTQAAASNGQARVPLLRPASDPFISPGAFSEKHLAKGIPGYFPSLVSHPSSPFQWPACREWPSADGKLSGLRKISELQKTLVDVEISPKGRGYGDGLRDGKDVSDWMKVTMPFELFLDAFIDGKVPWKKETSQPTVGYLAQQDLFEKSATLAKQCPILPHTTAGIRGNREQWRRNVWIGGEGSFTPIHCDPYENVFVQVVGSKRAFLFPPRVAPHLHLFPSKTSQANTSMIPTEELLMAGSEDALRDAFPEFEKALSDEGTCCVSLNAGDALYIPRGWFHCLRATSISASVNAWFR